MNTSDQTPDYRQPWPYDFPPSTASTGAIIPLEEKLVAESGGIDPTGLDAMLARIRQNSDAFEAHLSQCPPKIACPTCGGVAGLDVDASFKAQKETYLCASCEAKKREQIIARRCELSGIPSDVRHATIENFQTNRPKVNPKFQTPARFVEAAKEFLVKGKRNIILSGIPGIGKGHLAAAIAIHFIKLGWRVAWVECARLFRDYHKAYENGTNEDITDKLGNIALLVIDEICLRDLPADGEEILFAILDRRHKEGKPTVFLGNKPADEVRKWLGGRITDRLRSGGVIFCYGEWQSMRGSSEDGSKDTDDF